MAVFSILLTQSIQIIATQKVQKMVQSKPHNAKEDLENSTSFTPRLEQTVVLQDDHHNHSHGGLLVHSTSVSVIMLEIGMSFHSILIGVSLGITTTDFVVLLIAISFHQFFEGIALSAIVQEASFKRKWVAWLMAGLCNFF
jgi:zinc transporter 1/2/3